MTPRQAMLRGAFALGAFALVTPPFTPLFPFFLRVSVHHLLSVFFLCLCPFHYPASWTGNWNGCLFHLVFKVLAWQAPSFCTWQGAP